MALYYRINLKALSVNACWQGRRFKTKAYRAFERDALRELDYISIPDGKLQAHFIFGVSNASSDCDNLIKPFQDILQKKYGFNDKRIYRLIVDKKEVPKGEEFIKFSIMMYTL